MLSFQTLGGFTLNSGFLDSLENKTVRTWRVPSGEMAILVGCPLDILSSVVPTGSVYSSVLPPGPQKDVTL